MSLSLGHLGKESPTHGPLLPWYFPRLRILGYHSIPCVYPGLIFPWILLCLILQGWYLCLVRGWTFCINSFLGSHPPFSLQYGYNPPSQQQSLPPLWSQWIHPLSCRHHRVSCSLLWCHGAHVLSLSSLSLLLYLSEAMSMSPLVLISMPLFSPMSWCRFRLSGIGTAF